MTLNYATHTYDTLLTYCSHFLCVFAKSMSLCNVWRRCIEEIGSGSFNFLVVLSREEKKRLHLLCWMLWSTEEIFWRVVILLNGIIFTFALQSQTCLPFYVIGSLHSQCFKFVYDYCSLTLLGDIRNKERRKHAYI